VTKGRFANLDTRAPAAPPAEQKAPATGAKGSPQPGRAGKVAITMWVSEDTRFELNRLALNERTTAKALIFEALDLLARSRGIHPFGEQ
jgi:hypothetical protein